MKTNRSISTIIKPAFLGLVFFSIAFYAYNKLALPKPQEQQLPQKEFVTIVPKITTLQDSIVNFGMKYLGTPYVGGGCTKDGFDCSGFVYFVYQHFKINVPRSSAEFESYGKTIPIEQVQKGDLLLFLSPTRDAIGHIGIVIHPQGKASDFIHATSGRDMKVVVTSLATPGYTRRFVKAIRVL